MKRLPIVVVTLVGLMLLLPLFGLARNENEQSTTLERCVVMPAEQFEISAKETGTLLELNVTDGQLISEGQLIGRVDDGPALMTMNAAQTRFLASTKEAENESAILEAEAALRVANNERERKSRLMANRTITEAEFEQARLAAEYAEYALRNREYQREIDVLRAAVDGQEVSAAQLKIDRHQIIAPITGNVMQVLKNQNEWVTAGDSIAHIVRMDALRVEGQIDGNRYNPEQILGRPVTVRAERANSEFVDFDGRVIYVSLRQTAGKKYQVRAEVENRQSNGFWLLNPGATVSMTIRFE